MLKRVARETPRKGNKPSPRKKPVNRGGRPTLERVEAIERAILDAAYAHFLDVGFGPTAMEAIAATARVSKSTLYARYPTKSAMLRAVVEDRTAPMAFDARRKRPPMPEDFKQQLLHHARGTLEALASEEARLFRRLLGGVGTPDPELGRLLYEIGYAPSVALIADDLAHGTKDFHPPPRDLKRVAEMLMAMTYGWYTAHETGDGTTPEETAAYADHVVDVLFAARASW